ncbi:MAG: hypothetical protein F4026_07455, partial [Synechococcus sp. SB0669_bin_8]|nr:hypothetical protein [Synechococcus sp. SB0669_bin_8]
MVPNFQSQAVAMEWMFFVKASASQEAMKSVSLDDYSPKQKTTIAGISAISASQIIISIKLEFDLNI